MDLIISLISYLLITITIIILLIIFIVIIEELFCFIYLHIESTLYPELYPKISFFKITLNYCTETILSLTKYLFLPLSFFTMSINSNTKTKDTHLIILVHGYMRTKTDWIYFLYKFYTNKVLLKKYSIIAINLKPNSSDIPQLSTCIDKVVLKLKPENVVLIAHSMGGLVSSYYKEYLDTNNVVKKIFTLGTPFYGTKIAAASFNKTGKQMLPESELLTKLRNDIKNSQTKYFNITSKLDNLIFPWDSALLNIENKQNNFITDYSHLKLINNNQVFNKIISLL